MHMRRTLFAFAVSTVLAVFAGCAGDCCNPGGCHVLPGACGNQHAGCLLGGGGGGGQHAGGPGAGLGAGQASAGGMVSYPYYTLRGPRDFLETHPQSIGP